jgi:hypothetical protein
MLFSERSIWTMVHGIGLGGGALVGLAAALFYLYAARASDGEAAPPGSGALAGATVLSAVLLWLTVIVGTYVVFPPYRATPPTGVADLSQFPRALVGEPEYGLAARICHGEQGAYAMDRLDAHHGGRIRRRPLPVEGAPELVAVEFVDGAAGDLVRAGRVRVVDGCVRQQGGSAGLGDRR